MSGAGIKKRILKATFTLAGGKNFVESGSNSVTLTGLRMSARIEKAGGVSMTSMSLEMFGVSLSIMNQLSTLGMLVTAVQRNSVTVEAGTADGMTQVFAGTITACWTSFAATPNVSMVVEAQAGLDAAVAPAQPVTYASGVDVGTAMGAVAGTMGLTLENNGVSANIPASYLSGSPRDQARAIAEAAGINWTIDDKKLIIWPSNGYRNGDAVVVSKDTGLVGYPEYTAQGIKVTTLFNPQILFGGKIKVVSEIFDPKNNPQGQPANGIWGVYKLGYDLAAEFPRGPWFSRIEASNPQFPPQVAT